MFTKKIIVASLLVLALMATPNTPKATSMPSPPSQDNRFTVVQGMWPAQNTSPVSVSIRVDSQTGKTWVLGIKVVTPSGGQPQSFPMWRSIPEEQ